MSLSQFQPQTAHLTVVTYNIHKGLSPLNRQVVIEGIAKALQNKQADIICLQEVQGRHDKWVSQFKDFSAIPQHQLLADRLGYHHCYAENPIYPHGHHGNAILSAYPIRKIANLDISVNKRETRGMLHTEIEVDNRVIAVISVHLNLLEQDRQRQYQFMMEYIQQNIPLDQPLIVAGDFNDWHQVANQQLGRPLNMIEVMSHLHGKPQATFPARFPILSLDRIYVRQLSIQTAQVDRGYPWSGLSDHLPISTQVKYH